MSQRTGTSTSSSSRARKDQPWVDLISGMYDDGVMDLPFSFMLAQRGERNVLVDTGFMQDEHSSGFSRKFGIPNWISPVRMLAELGVAAGRRSPTSSSRTRISTTWARSPNSRMRRSTSRRASCCPGTRRSRCRRASAISPRSSTPTICAPRSTPRSSIGVTLVDGDKDNVLPGIHVAARQRPHASASSSSSSTRRAGGCVDLRRLRLLARASSPATTTTASTCRSTTRVGSVWEQLKTIDKINDEIGGDLTKLVILHDIERWTGLPGRQGGRGLQDRQDRVAPAARFGMNLTAARHGFLRTAERNFNVNRA